MALPDKQTSFAALSPQQQKEHRVRVGVRAQAILSQFWQDTDTADAVRAIEIEGWCDVLEKYRHDEIRKAWASYQKTGPRTKNGKLCKPDAGALHLIILRSRPKPAPAKTEAPKSVKRVTAEQAERIMQEAGYRPKQFGGAQ